MEWEKKKEAGQIEDDEEEDISLYAAQAAKVRIHL